MKKRDEKVVTIRPFVMNFAKCREGGHCIVGPGEDVKNLDEGRCIKCGIKVIDKGCGWETCGDITWGEFKRRVEADPRISDAVRIERIEYDFTYGHEEFDIGQSNRKGFVITNA